MSKTVMRIDARVRTRVPLSVDLECLYNDVLTTIYYKRFKSQITDKINFKWAILTSFKKINYSLEGLFKLATS